MFEGTPPACSRLFLYILYVSVRVPMQSLLLLRQLQVHFLSVVPHVFAAKSITLDMDSLCEDDETERIPALKDCCRLSRPPTSELWCLWSDFIKTERSKGNLRSQKSLLTYSMDV